MPEITKHDCINKGNMDKDQGHTVSEGSSPRRQTSMSSLIVWNVSKVIENKPHIDLQRALKAAQESLKLETRDANSIISQNSEERHLACAFLAWQQLGHSDADSLHRFIEEKKKNVQVFPRTETPISIKSVDCKESRPPKHFCCSSIDSYSSGPVVKLPVEPKTVLRLDYPPQNSRPVLRKSKGQEKELMNKIETACCLDSVCAERLAELDSVTKELRTRAGRLAQREAERVELLERAEAAWKDLEMGFQRRLVLAEEKEEDMTKQIQKLIEERNGFKNGCLLAAELLKNRSEAAEKDRDRLKQKENELCDRACARLRLSEESAKGDSALAEQQCKVALLDRDLQFKEEQASRRVSTLEGEVEAARTLTHEAERALRAELGAIQEQITQVSVQLLDEDTNNGTIKAELADLRDEKMEILEDLEGCKMLCEGRMQGKVDELMKKREKLSEIKNKVMECRCKLPVDAAVEVKRTPSLAALCRCAPEDKFLDSCSCTSLRSQLLSNLLADLFGGLQSELGNNGSQMPCKLLKCLEDSHNWDRASIVKSNLRSFFSQLLVGELDIAIATSIENYHAKWVGASCADVAKLTPSPGERECEGWQERALERRAQKLATKLAEQLFQEKAEQLAQRAKDIASTGPPPCECKPQPAVYQCLVKPPPFGGVTTSQDSATKAIWRRTQQDVTLLRVQIEDLKKASIKREDLKLMEEKIVKIVQHTTSGPEAMKPAALAENLVESKRKAYKNHKVLDAEQDNNNNIPDKQFQIKKKQLEKNNYQKKGNKTSTSPNESIEKCSKSFKRRGQSFAVNLCLCTQKDLKKVPQQNNNFYNGLSNDRKLSCKQKTTHDEVTKLPSLKQTKPITPCLPSQELSNFADHKSSAEELCKSNCRCLNKIPSNTSIDNLLETLAKWKYDLNEPRENKDIKKDQTMSKNTSFDSKHISCPKSDPHTCDKDLNISKTSLKPRNLKKSKVSKVFLSSFDEMKTAICKPKELERLIPASRESEYMGAINLDKSNENCCKCVENIIRNKNDHDPNYSNDSDTCKCAKLQKKPLEKRTSCNTQNSNICNRLHLIEGKATVENKACSEINTTSTKKHVKSIGNIIQPAEVVQTAFFPCGCDYYIKLLGVTLAETTNSVKNFKDSNDSPPFEKKYTENRPDNLQPVTKVTLDYSTLNKQHGDYIVNDDKALDIQSFKDLSEKQECICCENDESKDLELNMFHLLEEHLKGKLEEFKQSTCKSSCIPADEEEKIFSSIFQKVKHVITESTNKIACRCSKDILSKGSWDRAYGLLQEYLKIKIKRVQCLCVSSNESKDVILPDVLDKVCTMIEKDFQRLQRICTCNTNGSDIKSIYIENKTTLEEPVKDINTISAHTIFKPSVRNEHNVTNIKSCIKLSKHVSKSILLTQHISSQVSDNFGMETKSCDAMKKDTKHVQTIDNKKSMKSCQFSQFKQKISHCCSSLAVKNEGPCFDPQVLTKYNILSKNKDNCEAQINIIKQNEKCLSCPIFNDIAYNDKREDTNRIDESRKKSCLTQNNLPYVGYTINCTCDSKLGTCICTKSIVMTDNEKINSIWKKIVAESSRSCDVSYVLNGPKNNYKTFNRHLKPNTYCSKTRETEMCILSKDGLILKDSKNEISTTHNTTNTYNESLSFGMDRCYNDDKVYDCGSQIQKTSTIAQSNEFGSGHIPASTNNHKEQTKSDILINNIGVKSKSVSSNCECNMVPICHVKMLVENIENKLIYSQCTCDSLTSKVCPIHSKVI